MGFNSGFKGLKKPTAKNVPKSALFQRRASPTCQNCTCIALLVVEKASTFRCSLTLYHGTVGSPGCIYIYDQAFTYFHVGHVIRFPAEFNCLFPSFPQNSCERKVAVCVCVCVCVCTCVRVRTCVRARARVCGRASVCACVR